MFVLIRAVTYASLFIAFLLVYVPGRLLARAGIGTPASFELPQALGVSIVSAGAALVLWCICTFSFRGRGTPAPFDPPRFLVTSGPYRFVRNPIYLGAAVGLAGAALFYGSGLLLGYAGSFLLFAHLVVVSFEEPVLRTTFGQDYQAYCSRVRRWWPHLPRGQ